MSIRRLLFPLLASAAAAVAQSPAPPAGPLLPNATARDVHFDYERNDYVMVGDARLTDGTTLLVADEIHYHPDTGLAVATGHVTLTRGPQRLLADQLTYRLRERSFTAENIRFGEYPLYVTGASAAGTKTEITVNAARLTLREPGSFSPSLAADKIVYAPGQTVHAEGAQLGVGGFRPVALPQFEQKLGESLISYMTLTGGYRGSLGVFTEAGVHVPVAPELRLGGDLGFYSSRGLLLGPAGDYGRDDGPLRGRFRSGYIHDYGDRRNDLLGAGIPADRGYIIWDHQQQLTDALTLAAQVNYWSDSEVVRDFHPGWFFPVQEPDTFVESVYTGPNELTSLFARFQPNTYHHIQQRLPEARFDLLPFALGQGFYQRFNAGVAILRDDPPGAAPTLRSDRFDAYYALTRPFAPREWLSFTPVAGGRLTYYSRATGGRGTYTRALGEVGFDAALRTSGRFDYKNERWKIDGLRHLFTPRVSYRYVPQADKGQPYIPPIDREAFTTYLPPLGLGDTRNIDELRKTNVLRVGFDNTLQTRDTVYGSRDLVTFNVAGDFRFARDAGEREFDAIHTELAVMPARWLQLGIYESFTPQTFTLRQLTTGVTVLDGEIWSVRLANHYLQHQTDEYLLEPRVRLNEVYTAAARLQYDSLHRRFTETAFGLRQNLENTWVIDYSVTIYAGPRRESSFGLAIQIEPIHF